MHLPSDARLHALVTRILKRQARAVRDGDEAAFLAPVSRSEPALVAAERRLFENLQRLPLQRFALRPERYGTWPSGFAADRWAATAYIPRVVRTMRLRGFDTGPVRVVYGETFAHDHGRWRIVSDTDTAAQEQDDPLSAPWDLASIRVRRSRHVLGIFDRGSVGDARHIMAWSGAAMATVGRYVPLPWSHHVVLYALSNPNALLALGRGYLKASAVTFPVPGTTSRVVINPSYLPRHAFAGRHLLAHEFTHVALDRTDSFTPVWVQEGIAEWVATHGGSPADWFPAPSSLLRARRGITAMPNSNLWSTHLQAVEYDTALAGITWIARTHGTGAVWRLLHTMVRAVTREEDHKQQFVDPDQVQDRALRKVIGIGSHRLARHAAHLIVARAE